VIFKYIFANGGVLDIFYVYLFNNRFATMSEQIKQLDA
jgi:hypothetical protein